MRLAGKVAVVTGGSSGIGLAVAQGLAAQGARVIAAARRAPDGPPHVPEPGAIVQARLDVTRDGDVAAFFRVLGPVDVLVQAAGHGIFAPFVEARVEDLRAMLDVHVVGAFLCARAALVGMQAPRLGGDAPRAGDPREPPRGHIVMVGSAASHRTFPGCALYTAAKDALRGMTRVLIEEARVWNVRVTTVAPGATDTPIWDDKPSFDRTKMLPAAEVAGAIVDVICRPALSVEELVLMPPGGAL